MCLQKGQLQVLFCAMLSPLGCQADGGDFSGSTARHKHTQAENSVLGEKQPMGSEFINKPWHFFEQRRRKMLTARGQGSSCPSPLTRHIYIFYFIHYQEKWSDYLGNDGSLRIMTNISWVKECKLFYSLCCGYGLNWYVGLVSLWEEEETPIIPLPFHICAEGGPCEDTVRGWPSTSQKDALTILFWQPYQRMGC